MTFRMKYKTDGQPDSLHEQEAVQEQPVAPTAQDILEIPRENLNQEAQASEVQDAVESPEEVEQPVVSKANDNNVRELRKKAAEYDRVARERDEMMKRIQQLESKQSPTQEEPEELHVGNDDLVEGKHLSSMGRKIKALEKKLEQYQQKSAVSTVEVKLRSEYPDFDKVVCAENLSALRDSEPYLSESIANDPDLYRKAVSAYKLIKKMGVYQEDTHSNERELVQKNAAKPKPLASVSPQKGESPLSRANAFANGLTDDLKKQLFKEMMQSRG